jgi:hypothetical protein
MSWTPTRRHPPRHGIARTCLVALAVAACLGAVVAVPDATRAAEEATPSPGLVEVGRMPLGNGGTERRSGWLVLNPRTRRAYQVFESGSKTVVESFDLDTLAPRRRLVLDGMPIPTGRGDGSLGSGATQRSGEFVHAFDEEAGILYLALGASDPANAQASMVVAQNTVSPDARRWVNRYVAIDERAFDEGRNAVASFREPADHAHLRRYWVQGMEVDRHRTAADPSGRRVGNLVLLFAQPNNPSAPVHNHELVRWDAADRLTPAAAAEGSDGTLDPAAVATGQRMLDVCRLGTVTGGPGYNASGSGFQWELLVRRDEIVFVCNSGPQSAAVARMALDDGVIPVAGGITLSVLGRPVYDVVIDREAGRLFLRTTGDDGETWWVYNAGVRRFTGSLAAKLSRNNSMTSGLDPATGRLYVLLSDYPANFGGREAPVRGGLQYADTRLSSPVPFENVRPDMAYPAQFRIRVDPVTRRVFVRRGHEGGEIACVKYPSTGSTSTCPAEQFYRVFKDTIPVPEEQAELDDSSFTTDVAEAEGTTRASYLGSASGFGARTLLIGGASAVTGAAPVTDKSPCGRDDRELLTGSVGSVSVSDLSTAAEASSFDADLGTQKALASPRKSCGWTTDFSKNGVGDPLPDDADTAEFSFDKRDNHQPAKAVPDGVNDYEASCVGKEADEPPPPSGRVPREGFSSKVACDHPKATAEGAATGSFVLPEPLSADPATDVRVAKAHSEARIVRRQGEGITAVVDSWARGIVVPGVGEIGAVRAEVTVEAGGRPGTAKAHFERTICDIDFGDFHHLGCLDLEKDEVVPKLNEAATGRAEFRLRDVDPTLEAGSRSGYQAGIQRHRLDRFADRVLSRDSSPTVPALEVVIYPYGTSGRHIVQLAGAEATVSYGIACLNGQGSDGKCASGSVDFDDDPLLGDDNSDVVAFAADGDTTDDTVFDDNGAEALGPFAPVRGESAVTRFLRAPVRAVAAALRLLFNNPRELGLMTAVWLLLYGPFRLAGRHRSVRSLRRRRLAPT